MQTSARPDRTRRPTRPTRGAYQEISIADRSGTRSGSKSACPLRVDDRDFLPPFSLRRAGSATILAAKWGEDGRGCPAKPSESRLRHDPRGEGAARSPGFIPRGCRSSGMTNASRTQTHAGLPGRDRPPLGGPTCPCESRSAPPEWCASTKSTHTRADGEAGRAAAESTNACGGLKSPQPSPSLLP